MGNCHFASYFTLSGARKLFDVCDLISARRMQHQGWSCSSTSSDAQDLHSTLKISRVVVARNVGRARRRYIPARGRVTDRNADSLGDGAGLPEPSDDEAIPAESKDIRLTLLAHFDPLLGSQDPRLTVRMIPSPLLGT